MKNLRFLVLPLFLCLTAAPVLAQGTNVAFGTLAQDTNLPVEVTSDNLSVDQETGVAIFSGNVMIGQGEMRLSAPRVLVVYLAEQKGIERMEATGGVTLVSGPDAAESDRADYSITEGTIVMTGNVLLDQGLNALSADKMTVQLSDGTAQMSGRVKTIIQTGGGD
ncbi:lipopolysaccharide transport periplasmic protein LptA [Sulfitobacter sp. F26204]|uniref:lipopolysaccharide transport periplasmic protein LptA n=1 Tax=Sulfitobacter sp. F26204 TaxID=2996014 RepID=UPI00225E5ED1|nr:lipopolysaccharide transport periplasmic protein LptA [Sulfitobacter sp. F26204]MCX7558316.1 lipopolysaccharide transport periplasmic protein LptA [Sulfitobacter sp. F26204]